jgi:DNA-directed RNA polymerase specialized sigma24 family protein
MACTASVGSSPKSFIKGVSWPVDRAAVVALSDLGLSPRQIAQYFSVTPAEVNRLLQQKLPSVDERTPRNLED